MTNNKEISIEGDRYHGDERYLNLFSAGVSSLV